MKTVLTACEKDAPLLKTQSFGRRWTEDGQKMTSEEQGRDDDVYRDECTSSGDESREAREILRREEKKS